MLNLQARNERFLWWVQAINPRHDQEIISIDGKTARRSHDRASEKPAFHMVNPGTNKARLTLGQRRSGEKPDKILCSCFIHR